MVEIMLYLEHILLSDQLFIQFQLLIRLQFHLWL